MLPNFPKSVFFFSLVSFFATACVSSYIERNDKLSFFAEVDEDPPYYSALTEWTKEAYVIRDFETKYVVRITYLSPKMRQEFETRVRKLFLDSQPNFAQVTSQAGFFVSIFSPERGKQDIRDTNLWAVLLAAAGSNKILPSRVDNLSEQKMRWKPFFPYIDKWSSEFLVVFDAPSITPNAEEMVKKMNLAFTLSNADAEVTFNW